MPAETVAAIGSILAGVASVGSLALSASTGGVSLSAPPPPPELPPPAPRPPAAPSKAIRTTQEEEIKKAAARFQQLQAQRATAATILTSPLGVTTPPQNVRVSVLGR